MNLNLAPIILFVCLSLRVAPARAADDWRALVIGQPGVGAETATGLARDVAAGLKAGGMASVTLMRNPAVEDLRAEVASDPGADHTLVYLAAPLVDDGRAVSLRDGERLGIDELLAWLNASRAERIVLAIEDCAAQTGRPSGLAALSGLGIPQIASPRSLFIAASAGPGATSCPVADGRVGDRIAKAARDATPLALESLLAGNWIHMTGSDEMRLLAGEPDPGQPGQDAAVAVAPTQTSGIQHDVITLSPVDPLDAVVSVVEPDMLSLAQTPGGGGNDVVMVFPALPRAQLATLTPAAGMPEPSIIVGIIDDVREVAFEPVPPPAEVTSSEIAYDNLEARRSLQAEDPDLFVNLVEAGAFDPPETGLERALQTELQRMSCYTAGIDGIWGRGSRDAVTRYFNERGDARPVSLQAVVELFRQILLKDDVTCPAREGVVPQPPEGTSTGGSGSSGGPPPPPPPLPQPPPPPAPQPQTPNIGSSRGIFGVYR